MAHFGASKKLREGGNIWLELPSYLPTTHEIRQHVSRLPGNTIYDKGTSSSQPPVDLKIEMELNKLTEDQMIIAYGNTLFGELAQAPIGMVVRNIEDWQFFRDANYTKIVKVVAFSTIRGMIKHTDILP